MRNIKFMALLTFELLVGYRVGAWCADKVSYAASYVINKAMLELDKKVPVKDVMEEMYDVNVKGDALKEGKRLIKKEPIKNKVKLGFH